MDEATKSRIAGELSKRIGHKVEVFETSDGGIGAEFLDVPSPWTHSIPSPLTTNYEQYTVVALANYYFERKRNSRASKLSAIAGEPLAELRRKFRRKFPSENIEDMTIEQIADLLGP